MADLTEQQHEAVYRRGVSVVLSSGAGCGKTHVLTRRYLSHLQKDGAEVGQIVAITFTDRAAREMRRRIRAAVLDHLDAAGDEESARWEQHLRGLETAQISTIHSFCNALLRQHSVEAGLDPYFEVLEDFFAANLESEALTTCLQGLLTAQTQAGENLRELVLLYGWRPTLEAVREVLHGDAAWRADWLKRSDADVAAEWERYARGELLPRYVAYLLAASPKVAHCLWLLRTTPCLGPKMAANVRQLLAELPRLAEAENVAAAVEALKKAARVQGTEMAKAWPSEEIYQAIRDALNDFRTDLPGRMELFLNVPEGLVKAATVARRFVRVAAEVTLAYERLKRRHGVVDFQDLLVRARDLLRDHLEVRARLQRRYRFLLIDELQDTDPVQIELVELLCGAGLTEGKLFAVGDHSQSIYRFRGADVRLFQQLSRRMPHEGRLGLTRNFRSQPAILDFVNALFGPTPSQEGLEAYEPLRPHLDQLSPGACVEFLWSARGKMLAAEYRLREAEALARRLRSMIDRRETLVADGGALRPVRAGDVVLLFRSMSNVSLYEAALREWGLDYYLVGGRAFFAQQEIYDLLNLLRALENPEDAVSVAGTLRSPFCLLSDEALVVLSRHEGGLWAGLHDDAICARLPCDQGGRAARARANLDRWRGLKDRLPIARLLGEVLADSAYDAAVQFEFLGDRKLANLWKLVDLARRFDRTGLFGLAEFIAHLGDLVRAQPREEQAATQPENADVVRLMTIHQAKGLEFPVVILADLSSNVGAAHTPVAHWDGHLGCVVRPPADEEPPFTDFAWKVWLAGEDIEGWREGLRTFYVACTRARDYLVLSASLDEDFSPQGPWLPTLAQRFELKTGRCLIEGIESERFPKVVVRPDDAGGEHKPDAQARKAVVIAAAAANPPPVIGRETPAAPRIITVAELQALLSEGQPPRSPWQWDAEDGSDRATWQRPAERLEIAATVTDRVVRGVLAQWDFRDADGWRPMLARAIAALARPEVVREIMPEMEQTLACFAASETRRQLAEAKVCHREVEFLLPLENCESPAAIRGLIDCVWQDEQGDWHLLMYATEAISDSGRRQEDRRMAGQILGALAARQQFGAWPKTVNRYDLKEGQVVRLSGSRLPHRKTLAEARAALFPTVQRDDL
jgi:ATP-dependent helicase/nuclease subunit A